MGGKSLSRYPALPMEWEEKNKILFISVVTEENQEFLASPDNFQACLSLSDSETQTYRLIPRDCCLQSPPDILLELLLEKSNPIPNFPTDASN